MLPTHHWNYRLELNNTIPPGQNGSLENLVCSELSKPTEELLNLDSIAGQ